MTLGYRFSRGNFETKHTVEPYREYVRKITLACISQHSEVFHPGGH